MKLKLRQWTSIFLLTMSGLSLCGQDYLTYRHQKLSSQISNVLDLESFLNESSPFKLMLIQDTVIQSLTGSHATYKILIDGSELHHGFVKWNAYKNGSSSLSYPVIDQNKVLVNELPQASIVQNFIKINGLLNHNLTSDIKWFMIDESLVKKWVIKYERNGEMKELVLENAFELLQTTDFVLHDKPDTLVYINIFNPDPLTVAEKSYGVPYEDNNDAANTALNATMTKDSIRMRWDSDTGLWKLESDYAKALDIDSPRVVPPAFLAPEIQNLEINRDNKSFEYYNAFYHINKAHQRLSELGFKNLVDYPLAFDAHGSLADQSSFIPSDILPYLKFGDGGVDDAEDADVITHEYGHAISFSAAPFTNLGAERASLDEGFCDYFAISYSRGISEFNRNTVFDWDGHNPFWEGRTLTNTRTYPTDLENNIYDDGILWASAISEISDYIGRDACDQIMINSLYSWFPNMLMSDAARLFMQSDTLLNEAANTEIASIILCERGLLPGCEDTLISSLPLNEPFLGNTYDFAFNKQALYIYPNSRTILAIEVFDISGNIIYREQWSESEALFYTFEGTNLGQGIYVLRLITDDGNFSFKVIRLWQ